MAANKLTARDIVVHGYCAPKYERLRDAFLKNFREHGEIGASYAVMMGGEMVADLWAGSKDATGTNTWDADTVACIWSASKGVTGVCFASPGM